MKTQMFGGALLFALAGCDVGGIRGNGHMVANNRNVDPFINVEADGAFRSSGTMVRLLSQITSTKT